MTLDRPCLEERRIVIKQCKDTAEMLKCKWPKRCFITGKCLFLKQAVRVHREFTIEVILVPRKMRQYFWVDSKEYILLALRG